MNFIFPQNYKMKTKILGLIDYQSAIINLIWGGFIYLIINFIFNSLNIKIFLFIIFTFPLLIFSIVGVGGENILDVIIYFTKYLIKPKLLFYNK